MLTESGSNPKKKLGFGSAFREKTVSKFDGKLLDFFFYNIKVYLKYFYFIITSGSVCSDLDF